MEQKMIKLSSLKPNPDNPRTISDPRFNKLVSSIQEFPKMLSVRPLVVDREKHMVIGGNMRLRALKKLAYKEIPSSWVKYADEFTPEEIKRFIVQDNLDFGENDWEILGNLYEMDELENWGMEIPDMGDAYSISETAIAGPSKSKDLQYNIVFSSQITYNEFMEITKNLELLNDDPEKTMSDLILEALRK